MSNFQSFIKVVKREIYLLFRHKIYFFSMVLAPLFCYIFFTTLMKDGLPRNLPIGIVDLDQSVTSRNISRNLDAFQDLKIIAHYPNVSEARIAMQKGKIYGFFYLPSNLSRDVVAQRQPKISFYTNNAYLIAGSLLFKDMKTMSELAGGAAIEQTLFAKGATESQALSFIQPIVIDAHKIGNPWLNYSVYLTNTILPGILGLLIFLVTVYSIGSEIQAETSKEWLSTGNNSMFIALAGKILPQNIIFLIMGIIYDIYIYGILKYPCQNGIGQMILAMWFFIMASQATGIFMIGVLPTLRLGLSFGSLWGVLSFSISGFSYPEMGMSPAIKGLSNLFPLRHYFLIYVNQALNGYPIQYAWQSYLALTLFLFLPFVIGHRLKTAMTTFKYIP